MEKVNHTNALKKRTQTLRFAGLDDAAVFFAGMFSTMPIVCLKIFGRYLSLFTICFGVVMVCFLFTLIVRSERGRIRENIGIFLVWLVMSIFSMAAGRLYFKSPEWKSATTFYLGKVLLYILFAILWAFQKKAKKYTKLLLYGILFGAVLNLIWSVIDAAGYYVVGKSINNILFRQYAIDTGTRFGNVSLIVGDGLIRASGFNDDPAHIGFLAPAVVAYALYRKKGSLVLLGIASTLSSASTTALVGIAVVFLFNIRKFIALLNEKKAAVLFMVLAVPIVILTVPALRTLFVTVVSKFIGRITSTYGDIKQSGERSVYLFGFVRALKNAGIMILFGTGFGTASYAYVFDSELLNRLGTIYYFPYDMEMTYIAYFFDLGIIGFVLFMLILYRLLRHVRRDKSPENDILRAFFIGMVLVMLFYHFTLTATHVLITIAGLHSADMSRKKSVKPRGVYNKAGYGKRMSRLGRAER